MKRRYHVMEAGESLYSISQRFGIRLSSLCKMNPISNNYHFKVGDELRLSDKSESTYRDGEAFRIKTIPHLVCKIYPFYIDIIIVTHNYNTITTQ